jgi:hypothetical protein
MRACCEEWLKFAEMVEDKRFKYCPYCRLAIREDKPGCYPRWSAREEAELKLHWENETTKELAERFPYRSAKSVGGKLLHMRWMEAQSGKKMDSESES